MVDSEQNTIISLFAHPDDELGAVGTLANHVEKGDRVILAWTTKGELTTHLPDNSIEEVKEIRVGHGKAICEILGADEIHFFDFGDSMVENSRAQRVELAKFYAKEKPSAVVSWGLHNTHSDHKNTGLLATEAIQTARIKNVIRIEPHRKNTLLLQYAEKQSIFPVKYIDVTDVMEKVMACGKFYSDIYEWKNANDWMKKSRSRHSLESGVKYAERFNIRFEQSKAGRYIL